MCIRDSTSYYQQWHHLHHQHTTVPDPRDQLLTDLSSHIQGISKDKTAILIAMDANEAYTDYQSPLQKWLQKHYLRESLGLVRSLTETVETQVRCCENCELKIEIKLDQKRDRNRDHECNRVSVYHDLIRA